jgi:large conductance mechanosensitive channel
MKDEFKGFFVSLRAFALKGNVIDLSVAVIVAGAFGKIVTSLVSDVIMPLVNPLIPGGDWRQATVGPGIKIGVFAGTVVDFAVIATVLFLVIQTFERFKKREELPSSAETPVVDPKVEVERRLIEALNRLSDKLENT